MAESFLRCPVQLEEKIMATVDLSVLNLHWDGTLDRCGRQGPAD